MNPSLSTFREEFQNLLLNFLWRQWSALGVAGQASGEDVWIIDPEALLLLAVVTKPLTDAQRADLKRKFSTAEQLNKAERKIYEAAFDISEHYSQNWQATGFKAQLAAPSKKAALKYKPFLDEFGKVTSEVVISAPDTREENEDVNEVDSEEVRAFFLKLRASVKKRYAEEVDFKEYEKRVQKLLDTHVPAEGVGQITPPVNIFEREAFQAEVEKLKTTASKADTIAHRTQKTIAEKMDEDPVFYRKFSRILIEAIDAYRAKRISEVEYQKRATDTMNAVLNRTGDSLPGALQGRDVAKAFYGVVSEVFEGLEMREDAVPYGTANAAADMAVQIDDAIQKRLVVDWRANPDVQNEMRNAIDDLLYEARQAKGVPLTAPDMDAIIERALDIAKARYGR